MRKLFAVAFFSQAVWSAVQTAWAADPSAEEFGRLQAIYTNSLGAIESRHFEMEKAQPKLFLQELEALGRGYQQKGDLKGVVAVRDERQRSHGELGLTLADVAEEPAELRALKTKYRDSSAELASRKAKELAELNAAYLNRLTACQRQLTVQGKIDMAVSVQAEIDRINALMAQAQPHSQAGEDNAPASSRAASAAGSGRPDAGAPAAAQMVGPAAGILNGTQKSEAVRLTPGSTYLVEGEYFVPPGMTLEIGPGTVLRFKGGASLSVGGALNAKGSPSNPVRLVGQEDGAGFWKGVTISGKEQSSFEYAEVSGAEAGIFVSEGKASVSDSLIWGNDVGVRVKGRDSATAIENCAIRGNKSHGVDVYFAKVRLTSCTISGNGGFGIWGNYYPQPTLDHTWVTGNGQGGVYGRLYTGVVIAHDSAVFGNNGSDIVHLCDGDWDFSGCWWGAENTALLKKSDTANLDCIQDALDGKGNGRVRVSGFLEAEPAKCGASLEGVLGRRPGNVSGAAAVAQPVAGGVGPAGNSQLSALSPKKKAYLCDLPVVKSEVGSDQLRTGILNTWEVNGDTVSHGIFAHAPSEVTFNIGGLGMRSLKGAVGLGRVNENSKVRFRIYGDNQVLWQSKVITQKPGTKQSLTEKFALAVNSVRQLKLVVDDLGDRNSDHSIWIDPVLTPESSLSVR